MSDDPAQRAPGCWLLPLGVCLLLGVIGAAFVSLERSWGWDESMHAELPAARMLLAATAGEPGRAIAALQDCQQYPFVYPLVLATAQAFTGISEAACRRVGRLVWGLGLLALFLLVCAVRERGGELPATDSAPWIALVFGALSPLYLHFSGTLFLEVPFAVVTFFALRAWVRRDGSQRHELVAGAWIGVAFFTKFNYGVLLGLGLALDLAVEGVLAARRGALQPWIRRVGALALIPAVLFMWWFVLPLPSGLGRAAQHRAAFLGFMQGNLRDYQPWTWRGLDWINGVAATPRMLVVLLVGALGTLRFVARDGVRALWLVFLVFLAGICAHPMHLERFLIPVAAPLFVLSALGWSAWLPRRLVPALGALAVLLLLALALPRIDSEAFADSFGPAVGDKAYRNAVLARKRDLAPSRALETNGLLRHEAETLNALVAGAIAPGERPMWLGGNTRYPPAALHLALYERQKDRERFLRDAHETLQLTVAAVDPGWSPEQLAQFADGFDVILAPEPPGFDEGGWDFIAPYRKQLVDGVHWRPQSLGTLEVLRPRGPQRVELFIARRP